MKRPYYLIFAISAFILAGMFMLAQKEIFVNNDGLPLIILSILLLIGLIFITIRIKAVKNKEPFQDEYSKKVMENSAHMHFIFHCTCGF
jgi:hypothetical protein